MNKDQKTTEYFNKVKDIKLSESSRARIENNLLEYARFNNVKEGVRVEGDGRFIKQVPQRTSLFDLLRPKSMTAAIIAIALIAGGGTSYAAEGAVPGEFLYMVKTEVNENVKSAFAVSDEAEVRLQAKLAEERLKEAEELAVRGELNAKVATDISMRVKTHLEEVEKHSAQAEAEEDFQSSVGARSSLEGSFRAYADILSNLNTSVSGNDGAILVTDILGYAEATANAQTHATATIETSMAAKSASEVAITRADNLIIEVVAKLERAKSEVSAEVHARAEAKLNEAIEAHSKSKAMFSAEDYRGAYGSAQTAISIASEVGAMVDGAVRLQIDTSVDATIDTGILNVEVNSELDNRTKTNTSTGTKSSTETSSSNNTSAENDTNTSVDTEVDSSTEVEVDTGVINTNVKTDTSVRSGVGI